MNKYHSNIFEIPPNGETYTSQQNTQLLPLIHKNYYILNIGRVSIKAEVLFGTALGWIGTAIEPIEIKPGEETILDMSKNYYFISTVKVFNENPLRALIHVGKDDGSDWNQSPKTQFKLNIDILSKNLVKFGPKNIPMVGDKLDSIMDFFWPQKGSIWSVVIDESIQIPPKTKNELRQLRTRVVNLNALLEHKEASTGISIPYQYMQLMEDLMYLEKKFVVSQEATNADYVNYICLPYYSSVVSLKMCLYQYGILNRNKVGLNDDQTRRLLLLSRQLIEDRFDGAVSYINRVCSQAVINEYKTCDPQLAYDSIAAVYTYCGLAGLEFIPFWNGILTNPYWKKKACSDVVLFSTYFGRPSPKLYKQLVQEDIAEPLQPRFLDGLRNKMIRIDVWLWRNNCKALPKIGGLSIYYSNGFTYNLGSISNEAKSCSFNDAMLVKLTAWGEGAVDCLEFSLSDGRKEKCGSIQSDDNRTFELDQHFICGMFLANDVPLLQGQAANIAVSYQPIMDL